VWLEHLLSGALPCVPDAVLNDAARGYKRLYGSVSRGFFLFTYFPLKKTEGKAEVLLKD
jgi:hypothetical protein